jgi:hypothetical protein
VNASGTWTGAAAAGCSLEDRSSGNVSGRRARSAAAKNGSASATLRESPARSGRSVVEQPLAHAHAQVLGRIRRRQRGARERLQAFDAERARRAGDLQRLGVDAQDFPG